MLDIIYIYISEIRIQESPAEAGLKTAAPKRKVLLRGNLLLDGNEKQENT